ncbi:hypothetical protein CLCR_02683 [Cladophialophora carrionii]|uniref:Uncharacterized protein n=1 Tax=Cladophialophora carrionii TaxID=86049 RepID=A0A1C1CEM2_9EURO|nr:hypothetical protein CLCR_02683 [Cladophialophora carrionii]
MLEKGKSIDAWLNLVPRLQDPHDGGIDQPDETLVGLAIFKVLASGELMDDRSTKIELDLIQLYLDDSDPSRKTRTDDARRLRSQAVMLARAKNSCSPRLLTRWY